MNVATLDETIAEFLDRRGVTPEKLGSAWSPSGHRVLSAKQIKGRRIAVDAGEDRFVDSPTFRRWMRTPLRAGDVLLTSEAPLGEVAFIDKDLDWCIGQRLFALRSRPEMLDGRYLYYALQSDGVREDLFGRATGTTVQGIRQTELRRVTIPLPPIRAQQAIATTLGALDDKIDLNRRMNETLEETARSLFKSWFVDFEGRTEFVNTENGRMPRGWSASTIGDHVTLQRGTTYSGQLVGLPGPALLGLGSIEPGGGFREGHYKTYGGECPQKLTLSPGDLFAALKGATKDGSMVGSIARVPPTVVAGRLTQDTVKLEFLNPRAGFDRYVYWLLRTPHYRAYCAERITGSAQVGLSRDDFLSYPVPIPADDLLAAFVKVESSLSQRKDSADAESGTLASLRDYLLPKLLSGKVRVRDVEKVVEAVA